MNLNVWGPIYWNFLHSHSIIFDGKMSTEEIKNFLQTFTNNIPCIECREHYEKYIKENEFDRSVSYKQYILNLHNDVNTRLGKKLYTLQQMEETLKHHNHRKCPIVTKPYKYLELFLAFIFGFILTIILIVFVRMYNNSCENVRQVQKNNA